MGFSAQIADEVLVRCGRHCCLCGKYVGQKIELHHIRQVADGGDDSADNCIPLCFDCHAEVNSYNLRHPKGRKFTERELKGHRDRCYAQQSPLIQKKITHFEKSQPIFERKECNIATSWGYLLQDRLCPIFPGNLILIAGTTGMKKSTYVQHIVNWNSQLGHTVAYCCLKDSVFDVAVNLIAENAHIYAKHIKKGYLTNKEAVKLKKEQERNKGKNIALLPYEQTKDRDQILSIVETSGADIVVIDDFNGIMFDEPSNMEYFFYNLKSIANYNNTTVFIIYNLNISKRVDKRPIFSDFPSDIYYRLCDIVQFLYVPSEFYRDEDSNEIEIIVAKGIENTPYIIKMHISNSANGIVEV